MAKETASGGLIPFPGFYPMGTFGTLTGKTGTVAPRHGEERKEILESTVQDITPTGFDIPRPWSAADQYFGYREFAREMIKGKIPDSVKQLLVYVMPMVFQEGKETPSEIVWEEVQFKPGLALAGTFRTNGVTSEMSSVKRSVTIQPYVTFWQMNKFTFMSAKGREEAEMRHLVAMDAQYENISNQAQVAILNAQNPIIDLLERTTSARADMIKNVYKHEIEMFAALNKDPNAIITMKKMAADTLEWLGEKPGFYMYPKHTFLSNQLNPSNYKFSESGRPKTSDIDTLENYFFDMGKDQVLKIEAPNRTLEDGKTYNVFTRPRMIGGVHLLEDRNLFTQNKDYKTESRNIDVYNAMTDMFETVDFLETFQNSPFFNQQARQNMLVQYNNIFQDSTQLSEYASSAKYHEKDSMAARYNICAATRDMGKFYLPGQINPDSDEATGYGAYRPWRNMCFYRVKNANGPDTYAPVQVFGDLELEDCGANQMKALCEIVAPRYTGANEAERVDAFIAEVKEICENRFAGIKVITDAIAGKDYFKKKFTAVKPTATASAGKVREDLMLKAGFVDSAELRINPDKAALIRFYTVMLTVAKTMADGGMLKPEEYAELETTIGNFMGHTKAGALGGGWDGYYERVVKKQIDKVYDASYKAKTGFTGTPIMAKAVNTDAATRDTSAIVYAMSFAEPTVDPTKFKELYEKLASVLKDAEKTMKFDISGKFADEHYLDYPIISKNYEYRTSQMPEDGTKDLHIAIQRFVMDTPFTPEGVKQLGALNIPIPVNMMGIRNRKTFMMNTVVTGVPGASTGTVQVPLRDVAKSEPDISNQFYVHYTMFAGPVIRNPYKIVKFFDYSMSDYVSGMSTAPRLSGSDETGDIIWIPYPITTKTVNPHLILSTEAPPGTYEKLDYNESLPAYQGAGAIVGIYGIKSTNKAFFDLVRRFDDVEVEQVPVAFRESYRYYKYTDHTGTKALRYITADAGHIPGRYYDGYFRDFINAAIDPKKVHETEEVNI
jgi:hypothetical protein